MPAPSSLPALLNALNERGRAVTSDEIIARFGARAFKRGRASGQISKVLPGLYAHTDRAAELATRLAACTRWLDDDEAVSGLAACAIHGLDVTPGSDVAVVLSRRRRPMTPLWMRTRTLTDPPPNATVKNVRVVSLECAVIDEVWARGLSSTTGLIIDAIRAKKTSATRILTTLPLFPRIRDRRALRSFLDELTGGVHSYLEHLADKRVFNVPDLQNLERQIVFIVGDDEFRVDAYDRETKTAIELDSRKYHSSDAARRRDLRRDAALASIGIQTLRFTFEQIRDEPLWCRRIIRETIAARRSLAAS